jgi:hypothetical protein
MFLQNIDNHLQAMWIHILEHSGLYTRRKNIRYFMIQWVYPATWYGSPQITL